MRKRLSLRRGISLWLIAMQVIALLVASLTAVVMVLGLSPAGVVSPPDITQAVGKSLTRDGAGQLTLSPTTRLQELQQEFPDMWLFALSENGEWLADGAVPETMRELAANMAGRIEFAEFRALDQHPDAATSLARVTTDLGPFLVGAGGAHVPVMHQAFLLSNILIAIPVLVLIVTTLILIPAILRVSLRGLTRLEHEISLVDFNRRGVQLSTVSVPDEMQTLVTRINEALRRLDDGFELTERFFVNAAHELKTPIAIVQVRIDALPESEEREHLRHDVRRLANMVRQLLDLEHARQSPNDVVAVDLSAVAEHVVINIAPFAFSEGYTLSMEKPDEPVWINGDATTLERMISNLVQNAVQHGGKQGDIIVRVLAGGVIEVEDHGPGIPWKQRERIFEAFYRVNAYGSGSGLGLKMVQDIAVQHGGQVTLAAAGQPTIFRVQLPELDRKPAVSLLL